jgi:hypothetical protein
MIQPLPILEAIGPRAAKAEGWLWWFVLVLALAVAGLLLRTLRRWLVRPMPHTPSDTSDAWAEAGRRLKIDPKREEGPSEEPEEKSP